MKRLDESKAGDLVGLRFKFKFIWIQTPHSSIVPTWPKRDHAQGQERMGLPKTEALGFGWVTGCQKSQEKPFNQVGAEPHSPLSSRPPCVGRQCS